MVSFMIIKITRFPCIVHLIVSHSSENRYILIVTQKKLSKPEREQLINFISDVSINDDILINFIEMLTQKFELEQSPLLLNIRREGIML
jgi:hypothetical protein